MSTASIYANPTAPLSTDWAADDLDGLQVRLLEFDTAMVDVRSLAEFNSEVIGPPGMSETAHHRRPHARCGSVIGVPIDNPPARSQPMPA